MTFYDLPRQKRCITYIIEPAFFPYLMASLFLLP